MDIWDKLLLVLVERLGSWPRVAGLLGCVVALLMVMAYLAALEEKEKSRQIGGRRGWGEQAL